MRFTPLRRFSSTRADTGGGGGGGGGGGTGFCPPRQVRNEIFVATRGGVLRRPDDTNTAPK